MNETIALVMAALGLGCMWLTERSLPFGKTRRARALARAARAAHFNLTAAQRAGYSTAEIVELLAMAETIRQPARTTPAPDRIRASTRPAA